MDGSTQNTAQSVNLLTLPAEIRDMIYALAVVEDEPVIADLIEKSERNFDNPEINGQLCRTTVAYPNLPGISLVCRQTYKEASAVFFGQNKFIFSERTSLEKVFLKWITTMSKRYEDHMLTNLNHIIIECNAFDYSRQMGGGMATIEARLSGGRNDKHIEVKTGGILESRCVCAVWDQLNAYNDSDGLWRLKNPLVGYVRDSEWVRRKLNQRNFEVEKICPSCGKRV